MPSARPLLIIILTLLSSTISSWPEILAAPTPKFIGARAAPLSVHNHVRRGDEPFDTMILEARMDEPIQLPPPTRSGTINIEGAEAARADEYAHDRRVVRLNEISRKLNQLQTELERIAAKSDEDEKSKENRVVCSKNKNVITKTIAEIGQIYISATYEQTNPLAHLAATSAGISWGNLADFCGYRKEVEAKGQKRKSRGRDAGGRKKERRP